jgi:hypothetical protein
MYGAASVEAAEAAMLLFQSRKKHRAFRPSHKVTASGKPVAAQTVGAAEAAMLLFQSG